MLHCRRRLFAQLAGCAFVLTAALTLSSPAAQATSPGPTEAIRQFYAELQNVMQHAAQ